VRVSGSAVCEPRDITPADVEGRGPEWPHAFDGSINAIDVIPGATARRAARAQALAALICLALTCCSDLRDWYRDAKMAGVRDWLAHCPLP